MANKPEVHTIELTLHAPLSEVSIPFLQGMMGRMSVSYLKYGKKDVNAKFVDEIACLKERLQRYEETGNTEWLMDVANFCLAPESRVWMKDLTWRPIGDLVVGDELIGFTEEAETRKTQRAWRSSTVTFVCKVFLPRFEVVLSNGRSLITSSDHRWLSAIPQGKTSWSYSWIETGRNARSGFRQHGNHYVPIIAPMEYPIRTYEAGWLAGFLDGEGHANQKSGRAGSLKVTWGQNEGLAQRESQFIAESLGYNVSSYTRYNPNSKLIVNSIKGGWWESIKLLSQVRPVRLIHSLDPDKWGAVRANGAVSVNEVRQLSPGELIAIGTTTGTFVAEGFGHHNCMIEFSHPSHQGAHFKATDSDESPGLAMKTGKRRR